MSSRNAEMETWNVALPNLTLPSRFVDQRLIVTRTSYRSGHRHIAWSFPSINECATTAKNNTFLLGGLEKEVLIDGTKSRAVSPPRRELPFDLEKHLYSNPQRTLILVPTTEGTTSGPRNKVSPR